jgi:ribosome-associated protein
VSRRSLRHHPAATRGQAGPQPHQTTGSHLHPREHAARARASADTAPDRPEDEESEFQGDAPAGRDKPSKSQLKREMQELQELGERLLQLQPSKLRNLPIPPELIDAVELAQRISNTRGGLRRQRQYIGRLMREIDAGPLRDALSADGTRHRNEVAIMHAAEHWRERLLKEPEAMQEFATRHAASAEVLAELARLVDATHAEHAKGQPGRRYRELYRCLRDALEARPQNLDDPATENNSD